MMRETRAPNGRKNPDGSITSVFAQRNFAEVRKMAQKGPVKVTIHGRTDVVVLSRDTYETLIANMPTE